MILGRMNKDERRRRKGRGNGREIWEEKKRVNLRTGNGGTKHGGERQRGGRRRREEKKK